MIGDLALTYDWCFDDRDGGAEERAGSRTRTRPCGTCGTRRRRSGATRTRTWTRLVHDNPSDNYYYSFLRATMLLGLAAKGENAHGDTWITQFRETKVLDQLVPTFDAELVGGGSREGTGYGVACATCSSLYDFWQATTGEKLGGQDASTRARRCVAIMHQIVPTLDRFAPTGDQPRDTTASFFDYQRYYLAGADPAVPDDGDGRPRRSRCSRTATCRRWLSPFMYVVRLPLRQRRRRGRAARRARHRVLRAGHRRAVRALGLGHARDVGQPDRRPVHRSRTRTRIRAR